jgi:hypothetical protein
MIWLRRVGFVLFLGGGFLLMLVPMLGSTVLLGSVALIIGGVALLAAGMRRRHAGDSAAGGSYGDASGLDIGDGGSHPHGGYDGGHGGDGGH